MSDHHALILDLDGVLITTPPWKPDRLDKDNYSVFNAECSENLNLLLAHGIFDIWLSSSRRISKPLEEFNLIFTRREINQPIKGFLPVYSSKMSRKEEICRFITEMNFANYIILDDDNSLNDLDPKMKKRLIKTDPFVGFNDEKLQEALQILV